jgi:hypothetical protein
MTSLFTKVNGKSLDASNHLTYPFRKNSEFISFFYFPMFILSSLKYILELMLMHIIPRMRIL